MSIGAVWLGTVPLGKVDTVWNTFRRQFMGKIAKLAVCASSFLEEVFTECYLVRIVEIAAPGAFGA